MNKLLLSLCCLISVFLAAGAQAAPPKALDQNSARAFIESALKLYQNHGKGLQGRDLENSTHSTLLQLMEQDTKAVAAAGTDMPLTGDLDLLCDCEEYDGIWNLQLDAKLDSPSRAIVTAHFLLYAPPDTANSGARNMRFTLVAENGRWKIADRQNLDDKDGPLSQQLQHEIVLYQNDLKASQAARTTAPPAALDDAAARALITDALALYQNGGKGLAGLKDDSPFLHSSLKKLLADAKLAVPASAQDAAIALDPICACNAFQGIWNPRIQSFVEKNYHVTHEDYAYVFVSFSLAPPPGTGFDSTRWMKFFLRVENGRWKIADSESLLQSDRSLANLLGEQLERYKTGKNSAPRR